MFRRIVTLVSIIAAWVVLSGPTPSYGQVPPPANGVLDQIVDTLDPDPTPPPADTPDQVRTKFFQGTACPGNDASDKMVKVGPLCVDVYEASVWSAKTGGNEFGTSVANYPCTLDGQNCTNIFARSVAGVTPSAFISWFQAQQACANAGKRLLTNAEWQMAAAGTPDGSTSSTPPCNTNNTVPGVAATGSFSSCVSNHGVHDMTGNVDEWVADWVPMSTICVSPLFGSDFNCFAGASTTGGPGALFRGGEFTNGTGAGPFAVFGNAPPFDSFTDVGFRCAR